MKLRHLGYWVSIWKRAASHSITIPQLRRKSCWKRRRTTRRNRYWEDRTNERTKKGKKLARTHTRTHSSRHKLWWPKTRSARKKSRASSVRTSSLPTACAASWCWRKTRLWWRLLRCHFASTLWPALCLLWSMGCWTCVGSSPPTPLTTWLSFCLTTRRSRRRACEQACVERDGSRQLVHVECKRAAAPLLHLVMLGEGSGVVSIRIYMETSRLEL